MDPVDIGAIVVGSLMGGFFIVLFVWAALVNLKGRITIRLNKETHSPGEELSGTVHLVIKKKVHAVELVATLACMKIDHLEKKKIPKVTEVYSEKITLVGAQIYHPGEVIEYPFSFNVPDRNSPELASEDLELLFKSATREDFEQSHVYQWYLRVELDDEKGLDLKALEELQFSS